MYRSSYPLNLLWLTLPVNVKILLAWMLIKGLPCQTRFLRSECEIEAGTVYSGQGASVLVWILECHIDERVVLFHLSLLQGMSVRDWLTRLR
ncbi:hypothetical protein ACOSQ2_001018 [Xanthoceras sorbifolium]